MNTMVSSTCNTSCRIKQTSFHLRNFGTIEIALNAKVINKVRQKNAEQNIIGDYFIEMNTITMRLHDV